MIKRYVILIMVGFVCLVFGKVCVVGFFGFCGKCGLKGIKGRKGM